MQERFHWVFFVNAYPDPLMRNYHCYSIECYSASNAAPMRLCFRGRNSCVLSHSTGTGHRGSNLVMSLVRTCFGPRFDMGRPRLDLGSDLGPRTSTLVRPEVGPPFDQVRPRLRRCHNVVRTTLGSGPTPHWTTNPAPCTILVVLILR